MHTERDNFGTRYKDIKSVKTGVICYIVQNSKFSKTDYIWMGHIFIKFYHFTVIEIHYPYIYFSPYWECYRLVNIEMQQVQSNSDQECKAQDAIHLAKLSSEVSNPIHLSCMGHVIHLFPKIWMNLVYGIFFSRLHVYFSFTKIKSYFSNLAFCLSTLQSSKEKCWVRIN